MTTKPIFIVFGLILVVALLGIAIPLQAEAQEKSGGAMIHH
jgi:hypothetical protein